MLKVQVLVKTNYGNQVLYPIGQNAETFTKLTGTKTLSEKNISDIKALGFKVERYVNVDGKVLKLVKGGVSVP